MSNAELSTNNRLSPEYVLLGFLMEGPGYGYGLHQRLESEFGNIWHASQSQTYSILKRLEIRGDVWVTPERQGQRPERFVLHLSEAGRLRFEQWLKTPTRVSVHALRVEFISRLYFLQRLRPQGVQAAIGEQIHQVRQKITEQSSVQNEMLDRRVYQRMGMEVRVRLLRSILAWMEELQQDQEAETSGKVQRG